MREREPEGHRCLSDAKDLEPFQERSIETPSRLNEAKDAFET